MKRVLGILSVLIILCTMLCGTVSVAAEGYQLQFTATDMVYDATNTVWAKAAGDLSCVNYPGYAVLDTIANGGVAAIRKFVAPTAGTLKVMWGGGIYIDNGQGNLTGATVDFAITDGDGKILFPTNGDMATITEGTPLEVSLTVESVAAGDAFYFVVSNPSVDRLVCVLNVGVVLNDTTYSNSGGFLYDGTVQGGNGWYHQYAPAIVKSTVDEAENTVVALDFTEQEMTYESQYPAWGVNGSILTGSWSNWGYVDQTSANIRKLVMPRAGTFKIEHIWGVAGVTVEAGKSFEFAILNKDKKIIWPTTGGMATVTDTTPAAVDLTLAVEAGDAVYFVFNNGSDTPTPYYTSSVICLDNYETRLDNGNGGYGAADISVQGNGGWYYMYATDLTELKAKDFRDLSALEAAITTAENYTDLSGYTEQSAAALTAALQAAKTITKDNTQAEIDAAAAALTAAIDGLTANTPAPPPTPSTPPFTLPEEDPQDPTVALKFTEQLMTYDGTLGGWTADADKDCVLYPWAGVTPSANKKVALRKFVAPISGDMIIAWGNGVSIDKGQANFVITDKYGKIIYPENGGKVVLDAATPHALEKTFTGVSAGDVFYFIAYNQTQDGAAVSMHTAVNLNGVAYAENGNLANSANEQGAGGWYYAYATDLVEVKASAYKNLTALNEQIAAAKTIPAEKLALYSKESVTALRAALASAEAISEANTQAQIDAATAALVAAIKGLVPKATPSNVTKVTFTEKPMTYSADKGYWTADSDPTCILLEPLNYPTPVTGTNLAVIRKLVMPQGGSLVLKWGNGVYIDNTSGNYTGATAEFVIADKDGNIVYPQKGGAALIKEGTPVELDLTIEGLKKGDALYFITFNPSMDNVPVVYNVGVTLNGTTVLQTSGGSLYGAAHEQGPVWYYAFAADLTLTAPTGGQGGSTVAPEGSNTPNSPATGEESRVWLAVIAVIFAASMLVRHTIWKKGEERA